VEINEKENGIERNTDVLTFYMEREVRGEGGWIEGRWIERKVDRGEEV